VHVYVGRTQPAAIQSQRRSPPDYACVTAGKNGAAVAGCQPLDLGTTDFTARDGDRYPFTAQGLTPISVGALYNQALEDYIAAQTSAGGLGGTVTATQYPQLPVGVKRITIAGD
jgi:hypothetical protein